MSKELIGAFIYTPSKKYLWEYIKESFRQSNGPLICQIKREISSFTHIRMTMMVYFTKLKNLWDELDCLRVSLTCTCESVKIISELENGDKVVQLDCLSIKRCIM